MTTITLYRYIRPDGGVTVSPSKPDCDYTVMYRLVADDGMELVNGDVRTCCIDTYDIAGWTEEKVTEVSDQWQF